MGFRMFGFVCLLLASIFTFAAVQGMIAGNLSIVFIVPAVAAIALVIIGIRNYKHRRSLSD